MAKYTGTVLTKKGKELLARAILGEVIVFTKVEIGKGVLPLGTDKETLTALIDSFKILSITSTTKLANGGYRIRISFNNKGFIQDTYLREVGVYARGEDGVEILYSYCNTDTPNLIPNEPSGKIEIVEDIITYISSAATINAVVDQSNVYATIKDLIEGLATKENKFSKNNAFNKSFGTITGTIMEGNKKAIDLGGEAAFTKKDAFNRSFSHVISSTSKVLVASAYAVKTAYDKGAAALTKATSAQNTANSAQTKANEAYSLANSKEPKFNKGNAFNKSFGTTTGTVMEGNKRAIDLGGEAAFNKKDAFNRSFSHVINSTSKTLVASALAVKTAYDKALEAIGLTNTNKNAIQNNTEQIENLFGGCVLLNNWDKATTGYVEYTLAEDYDNFMFVSVMTGEENDVTSTVIPTNSISTSRYFCATKNDSNGATNSASDLSSLVFSFSAKNKIKNDAVYIDNVKVISGTEETILEVRGLMRIK